MTYQLTADPDTILRTDENAWIPRDPANRDYVEFLAWQEAGNTPEPPPITPEPEPVLAADRLASIGLTPDDLRALLG